MAKFKIGDKVRVKDRKDWPIPPYRLANSEGIVVKMAEWEEAVKEFQEYIKVQIKKSGAKEYIGAPLIFRAENLEKV
ncbi:MAG: hypothetical protein A2144_02035 [Chloroflexi bacterium RBG_16_50_9]|nr:MAG: hypothetical protein A2144_02035 [Chloroflexi bacterium RBG_16_50_9]